MEFRLRFSQTACDKCETPRLLGTSCSICGSPADERETDISRQRRRRIASGARALLSVPLPQVPETHPANVFHRLPEWIVELESAGDQLEDGPEVEAAQRVHDSVETLRIVQAQVVAARRRRPWISAWAALDDVVAASGKVLDLYLRALVAPNPIAVQRLQPSLQAALDVAASSAAALSLTIERFSGLSGPSATGDDLVSLARAAFHAVTATNLLDFGARASSLATRITGSSTLSAGVGFPLAMKMVVVEAVLDKDRFYEVVAEVYQELITDRTALEQVCRSHHWLADSLAAGVEARDAAAMVHAMAQAAWNERLAARALIGLAHALVEGPASHLFATILAVKTKGQYQRLRSEDSGVLIQKIGSIRRAHWIDGLDAELRNAHAHSDWVSTAAGVELRSGKPGPRMLSPDELTDRVFTGVESLLALDTAVVLAAAHAGVDFSLVDWRDALSLDDANGARLMLTMAGWQGVEAELDARTLVVSASAPLTAFTIGTLGALGSVLGPGIERIRALVALSDGRNVVLEGPTALLRDAHSSGESGVEGMRMAELLRQFTLDAQPLVSRNWIRRWSTSVLIPAIQQPPKTAMPHLRLVRDLAKRIGDDQLAQVAIGAIGLVRRVALGDEIRIVETVTFKRIEEWANLEIDPIRI